jgi:hypothetical protein
MIISTTIVADQTIHNKFYVLDNDITSLVGGSSINIELTFIDSTAAYSTLEIEAERWVHDCCLEIITKYRLSLSLKQNYNVYPKVTAYLRLRTPLSYIKLNQAANLVMLNIMKTENLAIKLFQASHAQMKVRITGDLYVSLSGASHLIMSGFVDDIASIYVHQAAEFDGRSCRINAFLVYVSSAGVAYVNDAKYTNMKLSYDGPVNITDEDSFNYNWINELFDVNSSATRTSDRLINYFLILFFFFNC